MSTTANTTPTSPITNLDEKTQFAGLQDLCGLSTHGTQPSPNHIAETTMPISPQQSLDGILAKLKSGPRLEDMDLDDDDDDQDDGSDYINRLNPGKGDSVDLVVLATAIQVRVHYQDKDPDLARYIVCPGDGCPLCDLGKDPKNYSVRPAYDVESHTMGVITFNVNENGSPKKSKADYSDLGCEFRKAVKGRDLNSTLVHFKQKQSGGYIVTARDLPERSKIPREVLIAFERRITENHGYLTSCYTRYTVQELRDVDSIRRRLEANGK